jgi:hypothetical protein
VIGVNEQRQVCPSPQIPYCLPFLLHQASHPQPLSTNRTIIDTANRQIAIVFMTSNGLDNKGSLQIELIVRTLYKIDSYTCGLYSRVDKFKVASTQAGYVSTLIMLLTE